MPPSPPTGQGDAASCAALAGKTIAANTRIESAEYLPDGGTVGTTKVSIPFCRVIGLATPTDDSHIGFEVWLPPASQLERQFPRRRLGRQRRRDLARPHARALAAGYATMSTDNGHLDARAAVMA